MLPTLYIISGLPGSGKTTLARLLAKNHGAVFLRIDTVEQAIRDHCHMDVRGEGYRLSYGIAADNLANGMSVVADSCNPVEFTRREWEAVAIESNAVFLNIEVICSDVAEHRRRVETRQSTVPGLEPPSWADVERREYHAWTQHRVVVDTAGKTVEESIEELMVKARENTPYG